MKSLFLLPNSSLIGVFPSPHSPVSLANHASHFLYTFFPAQHHPDKHILPILIDVTFIFLISPKQRRFLIGLIFDCIVDFLAETA